MALLTADNFSVAVGDTDYGAIRGSSTPCGALSETSRQADAVPFDRGRADVRYCDGMDVERIIDDIEQLQEMFEAPDIRPLSARDISAANRSHDEKLANSPWFRLW